MEILAYHRWLKQKTTDRDDLALLIIDEVLNKNNMAWDLLEETGDEKYTIDTAYKAADLILNIKD